MAYILEEQRLVLAIALLSPLQHSCHLLLPFADRVHLYEIEIVGSACTAIAIIESVIWEGFGARTKCYIPR